MPPIDAGATDDPTRAVVVLLDSLNRWALAAYGGVEVATPNLDPLAARSVRFTRHYSGSLPCMPARHDLLCGSLDFLWKPWGSVELWEEPVTVALRRAGVTTQLVSDHPHLFETGGENYHCDFTAWDYQRGHESDPWKTRPDPSWIGAPSFGRGHTPYDDSRGWFRDEADFPGPRTMAAAADWLRDQAPHHDSFLLFVDEFDPHEPFDTPDRWVEPYDDSWDGDPLIWPPYTVGAVAQGTITEREGHQIRARYKAKVAMIDHWLGRVLDVLDADDRWSDTVVVLCTDHGHYLGEKDIWGKPACPVYEPLGHTPLMVAWPGVAPGECEALTTTVDLHATLLDLFGATVEHRTPGRSLRPLLDGSAYEIRRHLLSGVWGREVHLVVDDAGRTVKYVRGPAGENLPLSMWSNRWSTMPLHSFPDIRLPRPDGRAVLDRMPGSEVPVIRQPFAAGDPLPYWAYGTQPRNLLYELADDPDEEHDLAGTSREAEIADELREALVELSAPDDQLARLGLS